ncbi:MAG TPA: glycosyltransferase family 39 protein [Hymenobacter sp.]|jgi:4-amino-4-deoxy-L-arabinose transferase-like glycosyltransferase|uniref:ArnT family glycosyltransferase n=1 Tax=Hymenobacter sp. TaxID=1898978 RepID=UPI002ED966C9
MPLTPTRTLYWRIGQVLVVILLAYLPLFWLLTSHPVQQWDEARTGLNGLNILRNREWLILRESQQEPDLWNCKPPLWPWLLALSFRLLGPGELGLRLPAALAALATTLAVFQAGRRWLGGWEGGLLAALILLTSAGYVSLHVTRTGDFDALLTLWTTLGTLAWLRYLAEGRARQAWLAGGFFFLAAFTKGVAGLLFGPGLVVATFAVGQGQRLRRPAPWLAVGVLLGGMATWYVVRESALPGYWQAVWDFELGGPALNQLEGHNTRWWYYLTAWAEIKFKHWTVPVLLGGLLGWRLPTGSPGWYLTRLVVSVAGSFMVVLALTQNRLEWYDAPMYPLLALLAAGGILQTVRAVATQQGWQLSAAARVAILAVVVAQPYWVQCRALARIYDLRYSRPSLRLGNHLNHQVQVLPELRRYSFAEDTLLNDSPMFYRTATEMRHGHVIERVPVPKMRETATGEFVVVCGAALRRRWERHYRTSVVLRTDSCVTLLLEARR